jgi:KUP system potassium uptake protein
LDAADLRAVIRILNNRHLKIDMEQTTFFVGRGTLIPSQAIGMSRWRDKLYILMAKNSVKTTTYFNLPPEHVLEMGGRIKL